MWYWVIVLISMRVSLIGGVVQEVQVRPEEKKPERPKPEKSAPDRPRFDRPADQSIVPEVVVPGSPVETPANKQNVEDDLPVFSQPKDTSAVDSSEAVPGQIEKKFEPIENEVAEVADFCEAYQVPEGTPAIGAMYANMIQLDAQLEAFLTRPGQEQNEQLMGSRNRLKKYGETLSIKLDTQSAADAKLLQSIVQEIRFMQTQLNFLAGQQDDLQEAINELAEQTCSGLVHQEKSASRKTPTQKETQEQLGHIESEVPTGGL